MLKKFCIVLVIVNLMYVTIIEGYVILRIYEIYRFTNCKWCYV